jgi:hypothetical protein
MKDLSSKLGRAERYREVDLICLFAKPQIRHIVEDQFWKYADKDRRPPPETAGETEATEMDQLVPDVGHVPQHNTALDDHTELEVIAQAVPPPTIHREPLSTAILPKHDEHILVCQDPSLLTDEPNLQRFKRSNLWASVKHIFPLPEVIKSTDWRTTRFEARPRWKYTDEVSFTEPIEFTARHAYLDHRGMRRWEQGYRGLELDPGLHLHVTKGSDELRNVQFEHRKAVYANRHAGNWPFPETGAGKYSGTQIFVIVLVTCLYGALHSICWHTDFPSMAEKWLWRISSLLIAASPGMAAIPLVFLAYWRRGHPSFLRWLRHDVWDGLIELGLGFAVVVIFILYVVARLYILAGGLNPQSKHHVLKGTRKHGFRLVGHAHRETRDVARAPGNKTAGYWGYLDDEQYGPLAWYFGPS